MAMVDAARFECKASARRASAVRRDREEERESKRARLGIALL
jgi:hypothetical protein